MYLVIGEKPSVSQTLAKVLGAGKRQDGYLSGADCIVSWCLGHLAEYVSPEVYDSRYEKWEFSQLPILPEHWQLAVARDKKKQFEVLKKLLNRPDLEYVVNACDAGREGELIFKRVYDLSGSRLPVKRLWISSMEDGAVRDGFAHLKDGREYGNLCEAAVCRAKADWLNDYLRLLYARIGVPYCPDHHIPITGNTIKEMIDKIMELPDKTRCTILSPVIQGKKGTHKDLIEKLMKEGYIRVRIDGEIKYLEELEPLDKNKKHTIDVVVDRIVKNDDRSRFHDSLETALKLSDGLAILLTNESETLFSSNYACKICGFSLPKLEPKLFSFNAPFGACPECKGLGITQKVDLSLLIPDDTKSIAQGGIHYYKNIVNTENLEWQRIHALIKYYEIDMDTPIKDLPKKKLNYLLYGSDVPIAYQLNSRSGTVSTKFEYIEGVCPMIERRYMETTSTMSREWYGSFLADAQCPKCHGARLNKQALSVLVGGKNIYEWTQMSIQEAIQFMNELELTPTQAKIAELVIKEIKNRLSFLNHVGLSYLTLDRLASTLSGGEAQRIRLATQIGSRLTGVMYVLDEPSIGLHQRDNDRLIGALKDMRDLGNTLIVVEHDEDTMRASDYIVDVGPGAGVHGGQIVAAGTPEEIMQNENSITGAYLSGRKRIEVPMTRRKGNGKIIYLSSAPPPYGFHCWSQASRVCS